MNTITNFLGSGILANVLALIGILIALLPQKDGVSIDNSVTKHYHFPFNNRNSNPHTGFEFILGLIILVLCYIVYALLRPYFTSILILLALAVVIRYRFLKIIHIKIVVLPVIFIILSIIIHNIPPEEVMLYWENAHRIDLNQVNTLSNFLDQLRVPISEILELFRGGSQSPLNISLLFNLIFFIIPSIYLIQRLFERRHKIEIEPIGALLSISAIMFIITSFVFYVDPNSWSRRISDVIIIFFVN